DVAGPVIVKTDRNYGGIKEYRLAERERLGWRRHLRPERSAFPPAGAAGWSRVAWIDPAEYPVFDSVRDVPAAVWAKPALVVQRFVPERDAEGNYLLRSWYLLGGRGFHVVTA